jgi:hypothetical protein
LNFRFRSASVQVCGTDGTKLQFELLNRVLGNPGHANRRTHRIAFDQGRNRLGAFLFDSLYMLSLSAAKQKKGQVENEGKRRISC